MAEEAVARQKETLGDEHPYTLMAMQNLANMYRVQLRTAEAVKLNEEVLEKRR